MNEPDPAYGLVMPFVVCASKGGPYDDVAFTAGYECGMLDVVLELAAANPDGHRIERTVRTASLAQVDLLAMRHGYVLDSEAWPECPDEWTRVVLVRSRAIAP